MEKLTVLEKITVSKRGAANLLDMSLPTFNKKYIRSGLLRTVDLGGRAQHVIYSDLQDLIAQKVAEQEADPSLKIPRNAGAKHAAAGRVANKWGRNGKPQELRPAAPKKGRKS